MQKLIIAMVWIMGLSLVGWGLVKVGDLTRLPDPVKFNVVFADGRKDVCGYISSYSSGLEISGCESKTEYHEVDPTTVTIGGKP